MTRQPLRFSGLVVAGFVCAVISVPLSVLGKSLLARKFVFSLVDLLALLVIMVVMVVGAYVVSGIQTCLKDDYSSTNSGQAVCTDRLLGKLTMSNKDCDLASPVFCQCNADTDNQRVCPLLPSCKCQNNQLCTSPTGSGSFVSETSAAKSLRLQVVYLCLGAYFLLAPLVGILAYLLVFKRTPYGWISKVGAWPGVLLVCLSYIVLLGTAIIPCALITDDRTFVVNTSIQNSVCNNLPQSTNNTSKK
jgi:predicted PurR-regulated permease PerM